MPGLDDFLSLGLKGLERKMAPDGAFRERVQQLCSSAVREKENIQQLKPDAAHSQLCGLADASPSRCWWGSVANSRFGPPI